MTTEFQFKHTMERPNAAGTDFVDEVITVTVRVTPHTEAVSSREEAFRYGQGGTDIDLAKIEHSANPYAPLSMVEWDELHEVARAKWRNGLDRIMADVRCDDREGK